LFCRGTVERRHLYRSNSSETPTVVMSSHHPQHFPFVDTELTEAIVDSYT
jgi:hypothetical protein